MPFESVAELRSDRRNVKLDDSIPQICQVLRRLQEQRALLTVQIGTAATSYTSAILEVVREEKYLVLDELIPREGHLQLQQTKQLQIRGILDGIEVRFTSNVTQISTQNGLPFYKVPFPSHLDYPQRRQVHRVPIPLNTGMPVTLLMPDERMVSGELRDISPEGLGIRVRTGTIDIQREHDTVAKIGAAGLSWSALRERRDIDCAADLVQHAAALSELLPDSSLLAGELRAKLLNPSRLTGL